MKAKIAKFLNVTAFVVGAMCVITMIYGMINFPLAPLRQVNNTFQDKLGKPVSESHYLRFKMWEKTFLITGVATFILGFAGQFLSIKPESDQAE